MTIKDFFESYGFLNSFTDEDIKLVITDSSERIEYDTFLGNWRELPYYIVMSKIDFWNVKIEPCDDTVITIYIQRK